MTVTLVRIMLVDGWHKTAIEARAAAQRSGDAWTGTIAEFWKINPSMTYGEMSDIAAMSRSETYWIGGGAAARFTIIHA